ncbi:MAG: NADPH:quinone reductase-like Zn-dependent oxidoreductase, partial [Myxococcota bacterium]
MKAVRIHEYGGPEVLRVEDVAEPECGPKDVLVQVRASSINPIDYKMRAGGQRAVVWLRFPSLLGMDISGTVLEVGSKVTAFAVGDDVFASPSHWRLGSWAQRIAVRESELAHKPANITHEQAASIPLVGLTAWDCLVGACNVQPGQRVLIQAGSGGVGSIAIQLARHLGAEVLTTCSPRNHELVADLGATTMIDYKTQDWTTEAKDVDVILESVGGDDIDRAITTVRKGGRIAAITANLPDWTERSGPALGLTQMIGTTAWRMLRARVTR